MKRILLLSLFCFSFVLSYSQSVLGINFGESFNIVESRLFQRCGLLNVHKEDGGYLFAEKIPMGNFVFDFGYFYFQRDGSKSYFSEAELQMFFPLNQKQKVIDMRDNIYSFLKLKYENEYIETKTNDLGFKYYIFGKNPKNPNFALGYLNITKEKSNGGTVYYYLKLHYGPILFVNPTSDF